MDMLAVDLTEQASADDSQAKGSAHAAGVGSDVTLWGRAANGVVLSIDEVAQSAGTVGYELMCALAPRVPVVVAD
jgi:alanine racemase